MEGAGATEPTDGAWFGTRPPLPPYCPHILPAERSRVPASGDSTNHPLGFSAAILVGSARRVHQIFVPIDLTNSSYMCTVR